MARIFITGSTEGLGRAAGFLLLDRGHSIVLHARSEARAQALGALADRAEAVVVGDLSSAEETRAVADQVNALGSMDGVIHNAGVYNQAERGDTPEGHAVTLAVNTLAPYLLTALIARPARLVYMSSGLHREGGDGGLGDLDWRRRPWNAGKAYAESKLHAVALASALARRWPGVISNAVDPGWVRTRMGGPSAPVDIETGARTQAWLVASDDKEARTSGGYWKDQRPDRALGRALDPAFQDALLQELEALTGVALPPA